jgi:cytochrome P450
VFNPNSRAFQRNPYPTYDQLRVTKPILYHEPLKLWFLSTYQDVSNLLKDRRLGRSIDHVMSREERGAVPPPESLKPFTRLSEHSLFDMEPPDHTRLRSLVHKAFTPNRVTALRAEIEKIANALLDEAEKRESMDIIEDFAMPLPVTVIAELLGVPEADRYHLRPWSQDIVKMYELDHTPEQERRAVQAATDFSAYLRDLARQRRATPQDDLMTALVMAEETGDRLTEDELISTCVLLLNAGHEATVNVIGNGLFALFQHPDQLQSLKNDPALVESAVEEMMRYDTPLQLFRRWVFEDIEYRGHCFKKGTEVALLFGSANRDPARFDEPDRLNIRRKDNPHISFGAGIHYCLGAPLARLELVVAVGTLFRRFPRLRLAAQPDYKDGYVIRGLKELLVSY